MSEIMLAVLEMPEELFWADDPMSRHQHNQVRKEAAKEIRENRTRIAELEAKVRTAGANERVFVGYTNGAQILYANDEAYGGEGNFYINTDDDCCIPLYMLRIHSHRLDSTTGGQVTLERVEGLQSEARRLRGEGAA